VAFQALQSVALGTKPVASGVILATSKRAFLAHVRQSGYLDLYLGFGPSTDGRIKWWASKWRWGVEALKWLSAGGSEALGHFHLHWVQGLLFGYGSDEIDRYLCGVTPFAQDSSSRPLFHECKVETSPHPRGGSSSSKCRTCKYQPPCTSRQFVACGCSFRKNERPSKQRNRPQKRTDVVLSTDTYSRRALTFAFPLRIVRPSCCH
jgi:hypothetical protein